MSIIAPDLSLDFLPLFPTMTESKLLQDWIDWANEGLDPVADADQWVDTREGSHWHTVCMPMIRECARIYDLMGTEVPMSGFVLWAWEVYLDDLAAVYEVERKAATPSIGTVVFSGPVGTPITAGTNVSAVPSTPDDPAPLFEVTEDGVIGGGGTVALAIQAKDPGSAGNVGAGAITAESTPLPAGVTLTNPDPTLGGSDTETDDALRQRVLEAVQGKGPGAVLDYVRWAGAWPGVGGVKVVPLWDGASTVLVMVSDPLGQPLPSALVDALQQDLDPVAGKGEGTAPIGAHVTVDTSSILDIAAQGFFVYEDGYSWDGFAGTTAVGPAIQAALQRYFLSVLPGGTVVYGKALGICAAWEGVHAVSVFELNGAAVDIAVGLTPPQVAILSSFTETH